MGFLQDIKDKAGSYYLNKLHDADRRIQTRPLELATSIGLLFESKSESDFILVKQYRRHLQGEYGIKEVEVIGWMDEKIMPDYATLHRGFTFIGRENVNWYLKPVGDDVDGFCRKTFDILIDLTFEPVMPLRFILKNSKAKMKVGRYHPEDYRLYDLTLNLKKNALLDEYLKEVEKYLNILKP